MDDLSIKFTEKTKRVMSEQRQRESRSVFVWLFFAVLANIGFYIFTYFRHDLIWRDGEGFGQCLIFSWLVGFLIFYQVIKIYKQSLGDTTNFDVEPDYESGLMGSYQYSSFQETRWGMVLIAGFFGALNLLVYLGFLIIVSR